MAFVYDPDESLEQRINADSVVYQRIETDFWEGRLFDLVARHRKETQSALAERLRVDWIHERHKFWQVVPKEMVDRLEHPISREPAEQRA